MHKDDIVRKLIVWTPVAACVALGAYIVRPNSPPDSALQTEASFSTHVIDELAADEGSVEVNASVNDASEAVEPHFSAASSAPALTRAVTDATPVQTETADHSQTLTSSLDVAADAPRALVEPPVQQFFAYSDNPELAAQEHVSNLSMRALRAPEVHLRRAAVSELAYTGNPEALDVLTQALRDSSPGVRFEAVTALRTLALAGGDASAILRALTEATFDGDAKVVASARDGIAEVEQLAQ